tara:strand:- start:1418 stop:2485 length:1068 start_codon:yes stop_codon:yes gene_type:complete
MSRNKIIDWNKACLSINSSIKDVISNLDSTTLKIALIVDNNMKLIGIVTDGDIRRGILRGVDLEESVKKVINKKPLTVNINSSNKNILNILQKNNMFSIPITDDENKACGIETIQRLLDKNRQENWVFLMAGGFGARLEPLTKNTPKPMLSIGGKPLLENILENFISQGFHKFYISLHYMAEQFMDYFGDGSKWGVTIKYVIETKPLGTVGSLGLFPEKTELPIIMMNGDILTKVDLNHLLEYHCNSNAMATMCVRQYNNKIPYGVVNIHEHNLVSIKEKPHKKIFVNAGIYVFDSHVIKYIEKDKAKDIPDLFNKLIDNEDKLKVFPIHEYWIDVGSLDNYEQANKDILVINQD